MQLTDLLAQMGGLQSMARELGASEQQVAQGAEALLPALLGGFKKQAMDGGAPGLAGLSGLMGELGRMGGAGLMEDVLAARPTDTSKGNAVLAQIFGSKDVSRAVAQGAAAQSGLQPDLLKKMLPMLAMLVSGWMARQGGAGAPAAVPAGPGAGPSGGAAGGLLGAALGGLLGAQAPRPGGAGMGSSAAPAGGLGGIAAMLDLNGDGNPLDDLLRLAGKAMR